MKDSEKQRVPPEFDPEQEQNKAECAAIWYTYAKEAEQDEDYPGAQMAYMNAWNEQPQEIGYFQALVSYFDRTEQIDEMIKIYEIGIQLYRNHAATLINFSNLLNTYGHYERAKEVIEIQLAQDALCVPGWGNLGNALRGLGDYDGARECFEKILKLQPDNVIAGFNLSNVLLSKGIFDQGWPLYESRLSLPGYHRLNRRNKAPVWKGESLDSSSILVYAEQGLGDTFMFSRYLRMLSEMGASLRFEVQKPISWLMEDLIGCEVMVVERKSLDELSDECTDYQIPLLSLAGIAHERGWGGGEPSSYLTPRTNLSSRASELLRGLKGVKVGLCWQGNPRAAIDYGRSIPLEMFKPLMRLGRIDFVSLQGKDGLEGIEACAQYRDNFHYLPDLDENTPAYAESVALINGVDLVVTSDMAIAHLAGAMGKKCWVLLQKYPEWRWGLTGETTSWYADMRLFRQEKAGEWATVIQQVKRRLTEEFLSIEG
jgi:Tfp pilus assembly protein PilF